MKKVSIVIPVYNSEKFLDNCIQSIINQTYKNLEIILIDDGSKDNSAYICNEYAKQDNRIKFIQNRNHGVGYTRNCGIKASMGDFIAFIDSDDTVESNYIEEMIKVFYDCDLVICNLYDVYELSNRRIIRHIEKDMLTGDIKNDYYLLNSRVIYPFVKLYKLNIIKENDIFFKEDMVTAEDQVFNYEYIRYVKSYKFVNKALYNYFHRKKTSLSMLRTKKSFVSEIKNILLKKVFFNDLNIFNADKLMMQQIIYIYTRYVVIEKEKNGFNAYKKRLSKIKSLLPQYDKSFSLKEKIFYFLIKKDYIKIVYIISFLKILFYDNIIKKNY